MWYTISWNVAGRAGASASTPASYEGYSDKRFTVRPVAGKAIIPAAGFTVKAKRGITYGGKMYRQVKSYENLQKAIFPGVGEYGIPELRGGDYPVDNWISFNFAKTCDEPEKHGIHFFVDDYQFSRLWNTPDTYTPMLRKFQAVCTPDFSTYTDFPKIMQVYNHYRKHWLGAYWEMQGLNVIPTISWSDESSYDWCFDGEPVGTTVAVSSVGTQKGQEARELFIAGYNEMLRRLKPSKVIFYGKVPDGITGNIVRVKAFTEKWKDR